MSTNQRVTGQSGHLTETALRVAPSIKKAIEMKAAGFVPFSLEIPLLWLTIPKFRKS